MKNADGKNLLRLLEKIGKLFSASGEKVKHDRVADTSHMLKKPKGTPVTSFSCCFSVCP